MSESDSRGRVLRSFVEDGKLVKIREAQKKRRVVLARLVDPLEFGRRYPEKEIDAFLKQFHEDFATLRRELVDGQFRRREESIYWRLRRTGSRPSIRRRPGRTAPGVP